MTMTASFVRSLLVAALALNFVAHSATADSGSDFKIEVIGVQASKGIPNPAAKDKENQMQMSSMYGGVGTTVHLFVTDPTRNVLGLAEDGSDVKITDDKGTDLSKEEEKKGVIRFSSPNVTDRKDEGNPGLVVELRQPNRPAKGATKLRAKGTIAVQCADGETIVEQKNVALKAKTKIKAGDLEFAIDEVQDQSFGDIQFVVQFSSKQSFDAIKDIEFLDADGKPIKQQGMGSGKFGFAGSYSYSKSIGLTKKVDKATLKIKMHKTIETVKVPIDLEVGLGF
jgi:hypothetical protein